ncbi:SDR family oxidoreductase [Flavobacterium agrisoli]|uniref:SDR family oxidoreductase n=1 Tax=Flavobacterium agrisoli TaxID=2793066 RepID=A0A934PM17_9FLAO|nr:SDR family oxidoreductase [Flavobacterium agrisoli]MBK0369319.1 SDR family oxidoreductase [Flavobacterium agrisoli]
MKKLQNKTAIITGSSRGLGKKTAIELAKNGANVIINYHSNKAEAEATVTEIVSNGGQGLAIQADVSQSAAVELLFEKAISHFGKVDILINNAGIIKNKLLKDFTEEDFDSQFSVNVKSVFLTMKTAAEKLETNGRIINISSSTVRLMMPTYSIYSATKSAVDQMTKVFAKEMGSKNITVNSVLAGPMNTELFLEGKSEELISKIASFSAFNRIGEVEDVIPVILFLCSDESQWVTGQNIGVNGGMA